MNIIHQCGDVGEGFESFAFLRDFNKAKGTTDITIKYNIKWQKEIRNRRIMKNNLDILLNLPYHSICHPQILFIHISVNRDTFLLDKLIKSSYLLFNTRESLVF